MGPAMLSVLRRLPRTQWLLTTLGTRGSILLERQTDEDEGAGTGSSFDAIMHGLEAAAQLRDNPQASVEGRERFLVSSGRSGWASCCAAPPLQFSASFAAPADDTPPAPRCTESMLGNRCFMPQPAWPPGQCVSSSCRCRQRLGNSRDGACSAAGGSSPSALL